MAAVSSYLDIESRAERYDALHKGLQAMLGTESDPVLILSLIHI